MSALSLSRKNKEPKQKKEKVPKQKKVKPAKVSKPAMKVPTDIYTLFLLFAWLALVAACVMAYLDVVSYAKP